MRKYGYVGWECGVRVLSNECINATLSRCCSERAWQCHSLHSYINPKPTELSSYLMPNGSEGRNCDLIGVRGQWSPFSGRLTLSTWSTELFCFTSESPSKGEKYFYLYANHRIPESIRTGRNGFWKGCWWPNAWIKLDLTMKILLWRSRCGQAKLMTLISLTPIRLI